MFWLFGHKAGGILGPQWEIELSPSAIGRRSLNNWTAKEVPTFMLLLPHIIWTTVLLFPESCPTISGCLSFPEFWSLSLPLNKAPEFRLGLPSSLMPLVQKLLLGRSWGGYRPHFLCHLFLGHQVLWFVLSNVHKLLFHIYMCVCVCVCIMYNMHIYVMNRKRFLPFKGCHPSSYSTIRGGRLSTIYLNLLLSSNVFEIMGFLLFVFILK